LGLSGWAASLRIDSGVRSAGVERISHLKIVMPVGLH
jgi:hypothetical protein